MRTELISTPLAQFVAEVQRECRTRRSHGEVNAHALIACRSARVGGALTAEYYETGAEARRAARFAHLFDLQPLRVIDPSPITAAAEVHA